jgi:transposase-like protein
LSQHRDTLLAFYDFPAEHWKHLRTTNPIESTFATVRHRTIRSKGIKTRNSGESGYVADQEKPRASAQPPGRPETNQTTTGSNSGPNATGGPKEPR